MLATVGGVASALVVAVLGHGAMVHPKPRNAIDGVLPFFNEGACAFGPDSEVCVCAIILRDPPLKRNCGFSAVVRGPYTLTMLTACVVYVHDVYAIA